MTARHPAAPSLDPADLVPRVQAGDRDAFGELMRRHNPRAFRIARSIVADEVEAEDVVQDSWVLVWRHVAQLDDPARFGGWLARIVAREATARARSRRLSIVGEAAPDVPGDLASPERGAQRTEARALIEHAVDALPEAFRAVFVLRSVEELSVAETAACLDIPEDTVKTRLHRARRQLRERLLLELGSALGDVFSFDGERCDRIARRVLERVAG